MTSGPCFPLFIFYSPGELGLFLLFQMLFFRLVDTMVGVTTLWYPLELWPKGQRSLFLILTKLLGLCCSDLVAALWVIFPWSEFRIQFLILKSPNWKENQSHIPCGKLLEKTPQGIELLWIKLLLLLTYLYLIYTETKPASLTASSLLAG